MNHLFEKNWNLFSWKGGYPRIMSGAQFIRNFLGRTWPKERQQNVWTVEPVGDSLLSVRVLYHVKEHPIFAGLHLVFDITIHEQHPYKAPSIKVRTPNGRMKTDTSICIDGLTAWHPESWNIITSMGSIVERFMVAFLDIEGVTHGVGFISQPVETEMRALSADSLRWNKERFGDLVTMFQEQCDEVLCATLTESAVGGAGTAEEELEFTYE